jgi:hypothetical protein
MRIQKLTFCENWVIILFPLISGPELMAQTETPAKIIIGDHRFTPITYSPLPSTNTYINTLTGVGQTINLLHSIGVHEDLGILGLQGEVTFGDIYLGYQQRIRDRLAA